MNTVIVLAMHGSPPNDFPRDEMRELLSLHQRLSQTGGPERESLEKRHDELDAKMRAWPRTAENDPFYAGSMALAEELERQTGTSVITGFNEFCAPSLDEALDEAAGSGADKVVVVTPMLTRGGEHSEKDIPAAVSAARQRHPGVGIEYVWPFELSVVAKFLAARFESLL